MLTLYKLASVRSSLNEHVCVGASTDILACTTQSTRVKVYSIYLTIQISQGSAATELRRGSKFYTVFLRISSLTAAVKELLKSLYLC